MRSISRVFERYGSYHIDLGRDGKGKRKSKKLCRVADGEAALYAALADHFKPGGRGMAALFDDFMIHGMSELAPATQSDYRGYINRTLKPAFGHMEPDEIDSPHVAQLLEMRKKNGARHVANKEVACLSSVFQYGLRNGRCKRDPTRGVRRNKVKPRDRYARHDEFLRHFEAAPTWLQEVMAAGYLMILRPDEVRRLKRSTIQDAGIVIEETKTSKVKVVKWSEALRFIVQRAIERVPDAEYIFTNSKGAKITKWAMHSAMKRLRKKLGLTAKESFHFHDLRAKGESDHASGGHELLTLYRRAQVFTPTR